MRGSCTDAQVTQYFPQGERSAAFKWKDYSPQVFQRLRGIFGIDNKARPSIHDEPCGQTHDAIDKQCMPGRLLSLGNSGTSFLTNSKPAEQSSPVTALEVPQDYLLSLTGSRALRELPSPGKSGSVFYLSDDERFLVKTVSREEARLLLTRIPAYYRHCAAHPGTLLTRFCGVHRVKLLGARLAPKARLGAFAFVVDEVASCLSMCSQSTPGCRLGVAPHERLVLTDTMVMYKGAVSL